MLPFIFRLVAFNSYLNYIFLEVALLYIMRELSVSFDILPYKKLIKSMQTKEKYINDEIEEFYNSRIWYKIYAKPLLSFSGLISTVIIFSIFDFIGLEYNHNVWFSMLLILIGSIALTVIVYLENKEKIKNA